MRGDSTLSLPGKALSRARCLRPTPNSQPSSISLYSSSVTALAVLFLFICFFHFLSFSIFVAFFSQSFLNRFEVGSLSKFVSTDPTGLLPAGEYDNAGL